MTMSGLINVYVKLTPCLYVCVDDVSVDSNEYEVAHHELEAQAKVTNPGQEFEDMEDEDDDSRVGRPRRRPFILRRFKGLTKGRSLNVFHKQHSDEVELSTGGEPKSGLPQMASGAIPKERRSKMIKLYFEKIKEGSINILDGDAMSDGVKPKWKRGRILLVKTIAGYLLQVYVPSKVGVRHNCPLYVFFIHTLSVISLHIQRREFSVPCYRMPDLPRHWRCRIKRTLLSSAQYFLLPQMTPRPPSIEVMELF